MKPDSEENPWVIPKPGPRPVPGPARTAWLQACALYRHRDDLYALLDKIDPLLRKNQLVPLGRDRVALTVLEFLEDPAKELSKPASATAVLHYLHDAFKRYGAHHGVKTPYLPLVHELGLEDGLLDGDALANYALHRALVDVWQEQWCRWWSVSATPSKAELAGALLMSAALFGGLPVRAHWQSLLTLLSKPVMTNGQFIWFDLELNKKMYRWIADPVTEVLIRRFTAEGKLPWLSSSGKVDLQLADLSHYVLKGSSTRGDQSFFDLLERAARGALIHHYALDVAAIALGLTENTALPKTAWHRLISADTRPRGSAPQISVDPKSFQPTGMQIEDVTIWNQIHDIKRETIWEPSVNRASGVLDSSKVARTDYFSRVSKAIAEIKVAIQRHYAALGLDGSGCYSRVLCQFVEDLLNRGGLRADKLSPATIYSYVCDIDGVAGRLAVPDMRLLSAEDRQAIYADAIAEAKSGNRGGLEVSLQLFECSMDRLLDLDGEVDWSALPLSTPRRARVDANLVTPQDYWYLLDLLDEVACDTDAFRAAWRTLTMLLYRFGLRRGEAHELTLADVHELQGRQVVIHVRELRMSSLKTKRAVRQVGPIVLSAKELAILRGLIEARQRELAFRDDLRDVYLFARPDHGSQLLDSETLFAPITTLLKWTTGDSSMRIHHFRHGFASRLFITGRSPLGSLDESAQRSSQWMSSFRLDGGWLRAYELGHVSPYESVASYCHTTELAHYHFSKGLLPSVLPQEILSKLAGLSDRSLERACHREKSAQCLASVRAAEIMLESARRRWPLASGFSSGQETRPAEPAAVVRLSVPIGAVNMRASKAPLFEDVLDLIRQRQRHHLDLSVFEHAGYLATQVRDWIAKIDKLIALGLLRATRFRKDRMPEELIEVGNAITRREVLQPIDNRSAFLARCLVGFVSRNEILVDPTTAQRLSNWIEAERHKLNVAITPSRRGFVQIGFAVKEAIPGSIGRLFLLTLSIIYLSELDIDRLVMPHIVLPNG